MNKKQLPSAFQARRDLLKTLTRIGAYALLMPGFRNAFAATSDQVTLPFENGERKLAVFPQKRPLIELTSRPPQLETPFSVFNQGVLTPNDAFFVRYHWSNIPTAIDPKTFRLKVGGKVNKPLELSLDALKQLAEPVETVAVNQCSGNSRAHFSPRVNGGQLSNGAMGNARWTGIPLKKILEKAGVKAGAIDVSFDGLDRPPTGDGPDFVKSIPIKHALDGEVMVAWGMNGEDLPMLNGYPLRLIVPGYYGTYWVKHLTDIQVLDKTFDGFWVKTAYRIPDNPCSCIEPGTTAGKTVPINRMNVRSFITSLEDGAQLTVGHETLIRGIAFDGGSGVKRVDISTDGGRLWIEAKLGKDFGRFSFREWSVPFTPAQKGRYDLKVRAVNRADQQQPLEPLWNSAGYMRNVVETTRIIAV